PAFYFYSRCDLWLLQRSLLMNTPQRVTLCLTTLCVLVVGYYSPFEYDAAGDKQILQATTCSIVDQPRGPHRIAWEVLAMEWAGIALVGGVAGLLLGSSSTPQAGERPSPATASNSEG